MQKMEIHSRRSTLLHFLGLAVWSQGPKLSAQNVLSPQIRSRRFTVPLSDSEGRIASRYPALSSYFLEEIGNGVQIPMAVVPGGSFFMGSNAPAIPLAPIEQPIHKVSVRSFAIGVFPVTRAQWAQVSTFPKVSISLHQNVVAPSLSDQVPIDVVFWDEAQEFCSRLQRATGRAYRLPTEAEWEYSCRAGTETNYHFGQVISLDLANYNDGFVRPLNLTPVGSKNAPNRFGLHDMHGNVLEWCSDRSHDTYVGAPADGSSWNTDGDSSFHPSRGGMFVWNVGSARSAARMKGYVEVSFSGQGLRLALDLPFSNDFMDPKVASNGLRNSASSIAGQASPGQIVSIYGANLGDVESTRVIFDGNPVPLLFVSQNQINAVVPYEVANKAETQVIVEGRGQSSAPVTIAVVVANPGLFTADGSGTGQCAAINQDGNSNSTATPAPSGSLVTLFATGEGQTIPPGVTGLVVGSTPPMPSLPVKLFIGGINADLNSVGGVPGYVAGLLQIIARVPERLSAGPQPVVLRIGDANSQEGVFISVG